MTGETDKRKPNMKISEFVRAFKDVFTVRKCAKCGSFVFFGQSKGELTLKLKNGKAKTVCLCIDCGIDVALNMAENSEEAQE